MVRVDVVRRVPVLVYRRWEKVRLGGAVELDGPPRHGLGAMELKHGVEVGDELLGFKQEPSRVIWRDELVWNYLRRVRKKIGDPQYRQILVTGRGCLQA